MIRVSKSNHESFVLHLIMNKYSSDSIEVFIDILRNRVDLGVQFIFNCEQIALVILSNEIYSQTKMTESTRSTDSVKVCLSVLGEVKVDDNIHGHNINTSSEKICAHQASSLTILEIMINSTTKVINQEDLK